MAWAEFKNGIVFPNWGNKQYGTPITQSTIDAADEGLALVCSAPKTGTISKIGFRVHWISTTCTLDIRLETVSTTTGKPTGTLLATNTKGTKTLTQGVDHYKYFEVTLDAGASVTLGDVISAVIKQPTSSPGSCEIALMTDGLVFGDYPYSLINQAVSPTINWVGTDYLHHPMVTLGFNDGSWLLPPGVPFTEATYPWWLDFHSNSTPDTAGLRFKLPAKCRVVGFYQHCKCPNDFTVRLVTSDYHQANGTGIIASISHDKDRFTPAGQDKRRSLFPLPSCELDADTWYRLIIEPTGTSNFELIRNVYPSADIMGAAWPGGLNCHFTTAKDPTGDGSWTNYNNSTDGFRAPWMGLIIDAVDVPEGGGATASFGFQDLSGGLSA